MLGDGPPTWQPAVLHAEAPSSDAAPMLERTATKGPDTMDPEAAARTASLAAPDIVGRRYPGPSLPAARHPARRRSGWRPGFGPG